MTEIYFIDIPVYRVSQDRYYSEMDLFIKKTMYPGPPEQNEINKNFYARNPDQEAKFQEHLFYLYGGAWNYNEIIGYIRLYFLGLQVRGEYWQVNNKKIQRSRRKFFVRKELKIVHEIDIPYEASNSQIYGLILKYLSECIKELRDRYIDISHLETIGPHVNWQGLLKNV